MRSRPHPVIIHAILLWLFVGLLQAESMTFDQSAWETGKMDQQFAEDSNGTATVCNVDCYYYHARMPMRLSILADSLQEGSSNRTYDSAVLLLTVGSEGLTETDEMRLFGKRLTRNWSENGVSWTYYWASIDSAWTTAGGDYSSESCTDTIIVDSNTVKKDTLYFHLDTGFVRSMIESTNFGWLMMAENIVDRAVFGFYTEDEWDETMNPRLTVYYTDGGQVAVLPGRRRRITE